MAPRGCWRSELLREDADGARRILEFATQVRPALPDNRPAFGYDRTRRVLRINGLYRHGFLLAPTVVEEALSLLSAPGENRPPGRWNCLREERSSTPFDLSHEAPEEVNTCLSA
jgi:hypothetical protein